MHKLTHTHTHTQYQLAARVACACFVAGLEWNGMQIPDECKEKGALPLPLDHTCAIDHWSLVNRVGQNRIYTYIYTVYMVISKPKIPYIHRIHMVLANPTGTASLWLTRRLSYFSATQTVGFKKPLLYSHAHRPHLVGALCRPQPWWNFCCLWV